MARVRSSGTVLGGLLAGLLVGACADPHSPRNSPASSATGGTPAGAPATVPTAGAGGLATDNPSGTPVPMTEQPTSPTPPKDGTKPSDGGCVGTSKTAPPADKPQIDLVWVVDSSASMADEQQKIAANLLQFADRISTADLDVHIVMLTTTSGLSCPEVLPPDPLAGSPLANDPRYLFIETRINSFNGLELARSSFPMYSSFLRQSATTHFVIVTDDDSKYRALPTPTERASMFQKDMQALLGKSFTFHTISSEGPEPCSDPTCVPKMNTAMCQFPSNGCGASAPGATYYDLAEMTHGLTASICQSDWAVIFKPLSQAIIQSAPLPCDYQIPPPPSGETLDAGKVNVRWRAPAANSDMLFTKAQSPAACGTALGWYYDDDSKPTEVKLCPATCKTIAAGGTLSISYGCATIVLE